MLWLQTTEQRPPDRQAARLANRQRWQGFHLQLKRTRHKKLQSGSSPSSSWLADRQTGGSTRRGSFHSLKRTPNWAPTWTKNWLSAYKPTKNWIPRTTKPPSSRQHQQQGKRSEKNNCPELFNISRELGHLGRSSQPSNQPGSKLVSEWVFL